MTTVRSGARVPAVSVILPVRNGARFLPQTLDSIAANATVEMEVIAVDDGSTDASPAILRSNPLVSRVLVLSGKGPAAARNAGLQAASADFVAFLDADDLWPRATLERLLRGLRESPEAQVSQGKVATLAEADLHPRLRHLVLAEPTYLVNLGSALFRRETVLALGGFEERLRYGEDTDLWVRLWEQGAHKAMIPDTTLLYRLHGENMSCQAPPNSRALMPVFKRHMDRMAGRKHSPRESLASFLGWKQAGPHPADQNGAECC